LKQKILFGVMAAVIFGSLFVGLKLATARLPAENMYMNPEYKVVNPTPTQLTFLYDVRINTTYSVSGWEAKLLFDPAAIRALGVVWGTFMDYGHGVSNVTNIAGTGESITLGQSYTSSWTSTGEGLLAQINFTFVLPGQTTVKFLIAKVWDDSLVEHNIIGDYSTWGKVSSLMPRPSFYWYCNDGLNPLPNHTFADGGDSINHYDVVYFNASASYDVGNVNWSLPDNWVPVVGDGGIYKDIQGYFWDFGDGTNTTTYTPTTSHVYQDYKFTGYLVNLTVWDSEGSNWSTTWRYGGPHDDNTVPMWRDVGVVDFWPSLMPFEIWDNGSGADWWAWWWYDTVDYTIPRIDSYYWNYEADNIFGGGTHASDWGIDILMTFANYGSVPELCKMTLYAIYFGEDLDPDYAAYTIHQKCTSLTMIRQMTFTIDPGTGTGWNWALEAPFMPTKNGYYLLFATIDLEGALTDDQNPNNNYMAAPNVLDTIYTFGVQTPVQTYAKYKADLDGDGVIGAWDWAIFSANFGGAPATRPPPHC